jgi:MFS family permease
MRRGYAARIPPSTSGMVSAWLAIAALSALNGSLEPTFGSRVGDLQDATGVNLRTMSLTLAAFPFGLVAGGLLASAVMARYDTRPCLFAGVVGAFTPLVTIAALVMLDTPLSGLRLALPLAWGTAGIGCGLLDTSHGVQAATFGGKRVHALGFLAVKGAGTVGAAGVADWAIAGKVGVGPHLVGIGSAALCIGVPAALVLPRIGHSHRPTVESPQGPDVGRAGLFALGGLAAAAVIPVGAIFMWGTSALLALGASGWLVGSGLVVLSVTQVVSLCACWRWSVPGTEAQLVKVCGAIAGFGTVVLAGVAVLSSGGHGSAPARDVGIAVAGIALIGVGVAPIPVLVQRAASIVRTGRLGLTTRVSVVVTVQYTCQGAALLAVGLLGQVTGVVISLTVVCGLCIAALPLGVQLMRRACSIPVPAEVTG